MTRDEARNVCVGAMCDAYEKKTDSSADWEGMLEAFDALNGLAAVNLPEATEEMIMHANLSSNRGAEMMWKIMSTWGDLTNAGGRSHTRDG